MIEAVPRVKVSLTFHEDSRVELQLVVVELESFYTVDWVDDWIVSFSSVCVPVDAVVVKSGKFARFMSWRRNASPAPPASSTTTAAANAAAKGTLAKSLKKRFSRFFVKLTKRSRSALNSDLAVDWSGNGLPAVFSAVAGKAPSSSAKKPSPAGISSKKSRATPGALEFVLSKMREPLEEPVEAFKIAAIRPDSVMGLIALMEALRIASVAQN